MPKPFFPFALYLAIAGCISNIPRPQAPVLEAISEADLIVRSDLIAIGVVRSIWDLGHQQKVFLPSQKSSIIVRSASIELKIDAVVFRRRSYPQPFRDTLRIVTWRRDPQFTEPAAAIEVGKRSIHFLRESEAGVHYVVDAYRSTGLLPSQDQTGSSSIELLGVARRTLVDEILPDSCEIEGWPREFSKSVGSALMIGGFSAVLPKLLKLVDCKGSSIRVLACEALVENAFWGQDSCVFDPTTGEVVLGVDDTIRQVVAKRALRDQNFKDAFLENPVGTAKDYSVLPGLDGVLDFLQLISKHPDSELADAAQNAIAVAKKK